MVSLASGKFKVLSWFNRGRISEALNLTLDYQYVTNPACDAARGPVNIFGFRVRAEF